MTMKFYINELTKQTKFQEHSRIKDSAKNMLSIINLTIETINRIDPYWVLVDLWVDLMNLNWTFDLCYCYSAYFMIK